MSEVVGLAETVAPSQAPFRSPKDPFSSRNAFDERSFASYNARVRLLINKGKGERK